MDGFSSARPNTEECAPQGAQSCQTYVSSRFAFRVTASWGAQSHNTVVSNRFAFRITASWGAQSHNAVVSSRFVFHGVPNLGTSVVPTTSTSSVTLWLCVVVCLAAMRGTACTSHQSGGTKLEVAHLWAKWLPHPCRLGDPHHFRAGGQNQKGPTCGQGGYLTPAVSGIPNASERGDKIRSGPLVGKVATSPLPSRGSPSLQSGGTKSEVAHLWAKWLRHPCRLGDPHRFRAGGQSQKWPTCGQGGYVTPAVSGIPTAS